MKPKSRHKLLLLCGVPALISIAYAATFPVRIRVGERMTAYRAIVIDGTTYIAARDVADMTGRSVEYDGVNRVVTFSQDAPVAPRAELEIEIVADSRGALGETLTLPEASLRIDSASPTIRNGKPALLLSGVVRNPSSSSRTYHFGSAQLILKDGTRLDSSRAERASGLGGETYAKLARNEEAEITLSFRTDAAVEQIDHALITLHTGRFSDGPRKVFRVQF